MRILILIDGLQMGGAERMACFLAGEWAGAGHTVAILTLDGPHRPYFELDDRVRLQHLGVSGPSKNLIEVSTNFWRRMTGVRGFVKAGGYEVVIGFGAACLALASLSVLGLAARSIAYEQTDPLFTERAMGRLKSAIHRVAMRYADAVVVQSNAARDVLEAKLWGRTNVVPNPVRPAEARATPGMPGADGRFKAVALGRLNSVKGYDVLLRAWARIHAALPDWILVIHGEGDERARLEQIIADEGLQDRAFLPGSTSQADRSLAEANLFVLTSRTEGFPNSLCEAMAVGLPVVATDCRCGPADIVTPGRDGLLVPVDDAVAIGDAILSLASDPQRLTAMGSEARAISRRFDNGTVLRMWDAVLARLGSR